MANAKTARKPRTPKVYADEEKLNAQLAALKKTIGEKDATETQKKERSNLRTQLGTLKFVRLAKARVAKAITAIRAVSKLAGAGYTRNAEQIKKISDILETEVKAACSALERTKQEKVAVTVDL